MAEPKINDQFWFDYSLELVKGAVSRLDAAINTMKNYTKGLLAVYTASAIFTIEYKDITNIYLLILFGLPYVIVLIGELQATTSELPKTVDFDPRVPSDIKEAYIESYTYKEKRLNNAVIIASIATFFVALTLMLGFIIGNKNIQEKKAKEEQEKAKTENYMDCVYDKESKEVLVNGHFPGNAKIKVSFTQYSKKDTVQEKPVHLLNSRDGMFNTNFKPDSSTLKTKVYLEWEEKDQNRAIIKVVENK